MKTNLSTLFLAALLPAAAFTIAGCGTDVPEAPQSASSVAIQPGVAGGVSVNTYQETAVVTAIDRDSRHVTLLTSDGSKSVVKCGSEVANFAQIEVGDQVKASVTERLVVFVRKPGEAENDGAAAVVALAPIGAKPGGVVADTEEATATVQTIDLRHRKATVLFADGTAQTFKVRPDVDMTRYSVGDQVTFRATESVAVSVEKP
jgi:Cu/Ag efflux protein CusF